MNFLDQRIKAFASQGLSPYEIETRLGIKHYTIHIEHHRALMEGYANQRVKETHGAKPKQTKTTKREKTK